MICFDHKNSSEENVKKAKDNMDTINFALTQESQETDPETYCQMFMATAKVFKPICDMITMLGGDTYVPGSIVLPYINMNPLTDLWQNKESSYHQTVCAG